MMVLITVLYFTTQRRLSSTRFSGIKLKPSIYNNNTKTTETIATITLSKEEQDLGADLIRAMVSALYAFALIISINSGFKEAPPTKKPSTSFWEASSLQLPPVTDPETVDHKKKVTFSPGLLFIYKEQHT